MWDGVVVGVGYGVEDLRVVEVLGGSEEDLRVVEEVVGGGRKKYYKYAIM